MRLLALIFIFVFSYLNYATLNVSVSTFNNGFAAKGLSDPTNTNKTVLQVTLSLDTGDTSDTLDNLVFDLGTSLLEFGTNSDEINIQLFEGDINIGGTPTLSSSSKVATFDVNVSFDEDNDNQIYNVVLTVGDSTPLTTNVELTVTGNSTDALLQGDVGSAFPFHVTGIETEFHSDASGELIYDADTSQFQMLDFSLTPLSTDVYSLSTIELSNAGDLGFDVNGTNEGVTAVYLYRDDGDNVFDVLDLN